MKLIVDIPDEYFEQIKNNTEGSTAESEAVYAIRDGVSYEERPQGEWAIGYTAKQKKVAVCNLCNCISFQGKTNFCHNCGASMRKGDAE